jgi:hypothetical protein
MRGTGIKKWYKIKIQSRRDMVYFTVTIVTERNKKKQNLMHGFMRIKSGNNNNNNYKKRNRDYMKISYLNNTLKILFQLFPFYHVLIDSWLLVFFNEKRGWM